MVVGHVCYGEHGEVTQVIQTHEAPLLDGACGFLPPPPFCFFFHGLCFWRARS